jgi:hypothetical protein
MLAVPVGVGTALALAPNVVSDLMSNPDVLLASARQQRLDDLAKERNVAILAELEELGDHSWAGIYRTSGMWPDVLRIAPKAGWTLYHGSWCGNCIGWRGVGRVTQVHDERLELEIELGPKPGEPYSLGKNLFLVRWGDLLFAIPEQGMTEFCADYSDGYSFPYGYFRDLSRNADPVPRGFSDYEEPTRPDATPRVPQQYEHLILDHPLECGLRDGVQWRSERVSWGEGTAFYAVHTADKGTDIGLAVGMRLHCEAGAWPSSGVVESVTADQATVVFFVGEEREKAWDLSGLRVSTQHPKAQLQY